MADTLADFVSAELRALADSGRARGLQAYMKSDMPALGVSRKHLGPIRTAAKRRFGPASREEWEAGVRALWSLPHREEKWMAILWARGFPKHAVQESMPLFEQLVREGAWWDFVDEIASALVGEVWLRHRAWTGPVMDTWIADHDLWIRRSAILGQLKHREQTDVERLLGYCRRCAPEKSFWIRKAIGWALRTHARTEPDVVRVFLDEMGDGLSGLSRREAAKHL